MTQEEKAKAYDEALERAKMYHQNAKEAGDYSAGARYENIFPELAESEDEKIRKALIDGVRQIRCKNGITQEQMLVYLEKQKENAEGDFARGYDCGYECCLNSHGAEWLEKPKEQKPARWSEEDEEMFKACIAFIADEKFKGYEKSYECIDWLKSLRSRPKVSDNWKPSEQEKGALRTAICVLTEERSFPKAAGHLQAILDAFEGKESRKDWKPNEEQIRALEDLMRWGVYLSVYPKIEKQIESLYEDLKKL